MVVIAGLPASIGFGRFRVLPHRREMIADGKPIKVGGRAFDILMALIEARGAAITKNALMGRVWPDRVVEENNLQSHILALRAVLGQDRDLIRTVSRRGYQFVGEIRALPEAGDERTSLGPEEAEPATLPPTHVPESVSKLIGRDDELADLVNLMGAHRLVTLTGGRGHRQDAAGRRAFTRTAAEAPNRFFCPWRVIRRSSVLAGLVARLGCIRSVSGT